MVERPAHKTINKYSKFNKTMQFRLGKINRAKNCFIAEISERETITETLNK